MTAAVSLGLMGGLPQHLADRGWDVHVVSGPGRQLDEVRQSENVSVHTLVMARNPSPLSDLRAFVNWIRLLRRLRPDLVLAGTPKASLLGVVAARLTGVPARVYHVRGLRMETARGGLRVILSLLERLTFAASTAAIAVSPSLADRVAELRLGGGRKLIVLGRGSSNGVDVDRFRPVPLPDPAVEELRRSLDLKDTVPVIGYVGRINRDKGVDTLIAASRQLETDGLHHRLLIVGQVEGADDELRSQLDQLHDTAVLTGSVPDTAPYYGLMDLLSLPTRREGFPNVALEAAASGLPVITTDATGAVDSVVHDVTGLITPTGEVDALAGAIRDLVESDERRHQMGAAGRDLVEQDFDRVRVQNDLEEYLRSLVPGRGGNRQS